MARASTLTKLPLDRWAQILGINPLHFNGLTSTALANTTCAQPWQQHAWQQNGAISREDVALFIAQAEQDIQNQLGFHLLPTWVTRDEKLTHRPGVMESFNLNGLNARGYRQTVKAQYGHFITGGVSAKTLLEASASIIYTDDDNDGYLETAWVEITSSAVTDPEEVAVYFPGQSGGDAWEIRPLRSVTISGTTITIKMWAYQTVDPAHWESLGAVSIDGDDLDNFLSVVDVYRHYNDPQTQATLIWEPRGTCESQLQSQTGFLIGTDDRLGILGYFPGAWNATTELFDIASFTVSRNPDRVQMYYRAGYRDLSLAAPTLTMASALERAVVYYSLALMDRSICGCNNLDNVVKLWAEDLSLVWSNPTASAQFRASDSDLANPFGPKRGAIQAWRIVKQEGLALGRAVEA